MGMEGEEGKTQLSDPEINGLQFFLLSSSLSCQKEGEEIKGAIFLKVSPDKQKKKRN